MDEVIKIVCNDLFQEERAGNIKCMKCKDKKSETLPNRKHFKADDKMATFWISNQENKIEPIVKLQLRIHGKQ